MPASSARTGGDRVDIESVVDLVRSRYDQLSRSERRVADLVIESPLFMSGYTATELAEAARVSKATITRFIAKLGLPSFDDFRRAARDSHIYAAGSPLQLMAREIATTHGDLSLLVDQTLRGDIFNLNQTYSELSVDDLAESVRLLSESRKVVFADFRKQYALAYYAATLFNAIRQGVSTLPILGASAVDGMLDIGRDDTVITFPFRRPQHDQDVLSRAVIAAGANLVAIGDVWPSPPNQRATIYLRCRSDSVGVFDSFVTPISLINLLFTATANRLGQSAWDRLTLLEEKHKQFETFLPGYQSDLDANRPS
jgi:DNA-binding MurR/RpiR family transcriptional regulator